MIYYIIDVRVPGRYKMILNIPGKLGKDYLYHFVYPTQSMATIVRDTKGFMVEAKLGNRSVDMIRLAGHGNSGYVQIGTGLTESTAPEFGKLASFLKADAFNDGVQIHGCGVGSDTNIASADSTPANITCIPGSAKGGKGYRLLKKFADITRRNATAALDCQFLDPQWKFEGPTLTVCPGGSYAVSRTYKK